MSEFEEGSTVQLKSGGPIMTVSGKQTDGSYWCVWFNQSKDGRRQVKGAAFKASMLTVAAAPSTKR
jgi:uncharacterized protein YodC (DUF2158 family)